MGQHDFKMSEDFFNIQTSEPSTSTDIQTSTNILLSQEWEQEKQEADPENQDNFPSPVVEVQETLAQLSDLISPRLSADPNGYQTALN